MSRVATLTLSAVVVLIVGVWPIVEYRNVYTFDKRLREVDPGRVYRSGEMTAAGFADAIARYKIRTILNLQDDYPDPDVTRSFWNWNTLKESELCRQLGVRYVLIKPDLIFRRRVPAERPAAVDAFLDLMDDPDAYPVLIHCKPACIARAVSPPSTAWSTRDGRRIGRMTNSRGTASATGSALPATTTSTNTCWEYRRGLRGLKPSPIAEGPSSVRPKGRKGADGIEDAGATE